MQRTYRDHGRGNRQQRAKLARQVVAAATARGIAEELVREATAHASSSSLRAGLALLTGRERR